ncbi:MAG: hypothetical protein NT155_00420 [Candidatus Staskawiczbacteria bacterium]|nr:hypothetical protein [Candidatus Staskawiczbacteria bacterium]
MESETKVCQNCKHEFTIEPEDFDFYEKMKVPAPTFCPECRLTKRLAWRNERTLFKRKCDLCQKDKIVMFPQNSFFKVYCYECWWSDNWDAAVYARDYDFSKPFFSQFNELFRAVPRMGIIQQHVNVNSDYTNRASDNKNCYLIFAAADNENCSYGTSFWGAKESMDCYNLHSSELCYECIDVYSSNRLKYSQECVSCSNSAFLINCRNCDSCLGCVNLRNKSYCLFNEQYSKEEYKEKIKDFDLGNTETIGVLRNKLSLIVSQKIVPALVSRHSVKSSGNWLEECKNVSSGFNCKKVEDGKNLFGIMEAKDVMDYTYWGKSSELIYECSSIGYQCSSVYFSNECWDGLTGAEYCVNCHLSSNLFGCVGLRNKHYCIFNKQFTKEEYEKFVSKIKEQMKSMPFKGERGINYSYGDTFPLEFMPFPYNQTIAQEFFSKTKDQAGSLGYAWGEDKQRQYEITLHSDKIPQSIDKADEVITKEIIECNHRGSCGDNCTVAFKITPEEFQFYKKMRIPIPSLCHNCRHFERVKQRNPLKLWHRQCMCDKKHSHHTGKCTNEFETSYAPDRPEIVYCESCYNAEVA